MTNNRWRAAFLAAALLAALLALPVTAAEWEEQRPMWHHGLVESMFESFSGWVAKFGAEVEPHGSPAMPQDDGIDAPINDPQGMEPEAEPSS